MPNDGTVGSIHTLGFAETAIITLMSVARRRKGSGHWLRAHISVLGIAGRDGDTLDNQTFP